MRLKNRVLITVLVSGLMVTLKAAPADSVKTVEKDGQLIVHHQVEQGETLYALSKRYLTSPKEIIQFNSIQNNEIEIGQLLQIPYGGVPDPSQASITENTAAATVKRHEVAPGETLFSISRAYGVTVAEIKEWNDLKSNVLDVGQLLVIGNTTNRKSVEEVTEQSLLKNTGYKYSVRSGDNLRSIARKFEVEVDSIKNWNDLSSNKITLGQVLYFPFEIEGEREKKVTEVEGFKRTNYGSKYKSWEEGGVVKIKEEGVAKVIDGGFETSNYLALHRNLGIGTVLQVKNLMNNQKIYVRIVGKLPDTGLNENTMIRLTQVSFEKLGIIDKKALVEITYFKQ